MEDPTAGHKSNIEVAINFLGAVTEHNAKLDRTPDSWNTTYKVSLDLHAVVSAELVRPLVWLWVLIRLGSLAIIALIFIVVLSSRHRTVTTLSAHTLMFSSNR